MDYSRVMSTEDKIRHYQRSIERSEHDYKRLHHCIDVLGKLPVTVDHLQEIGIGRTVNSLRKIKCGVGDAARLLVIKWKNMVAQQESQSSDEEDEACVPDVPECYESPEHDFEPESTINEEGYEPQAMTKPFTPPMVIDTDMMNSIKQELDNDAESSGDEDIITTAIDKNEKYKTSKHSSERSSSKDNSDKSSSSKDKHKSSRDKHESSKVPKNSDCNEQKKKDKHRSKSNSSSSSSKDKKNSDSNKRKVDSGSDCESDKKKRKKSVSEEEEDDQDEKDENNFVINENDSSDENEKNLDDGGDEEEDSIDTKKSSSSHKSRDKKSSLKSASDKSKSKDKHRSSSRDKKENKHSSSKSDKKHSSKESSKSKSSLNSSSNSNSSSSSSKDRSKDREKDKSSSKEKIKESSGKHKDEKDKNKKEVKDDMGKCKEKSHKEHKSSSLLLKDVKEHKENKDGKEQKESKGKKKVKKPIDGSIDHMSGTSFADALGMCTMPPPSKKKKESVSSSSAIKSSKSSEQPSTSSSSSSTSRSSSSSQKVKNDLPDSPEELPLLSSTVKLEPLKSLEEEVDLAATLPEPSLNYKPLPYVNPAQRRQEEDAMLQQVIYAKNQRTKVFSGNKCSSNTIPSLYELCIRILIENIDALEFTGGVPYYIIKPVLERATPDQLFMLEHYNPYLMEDSDALWQFHCNKDFRTKKREEMESWREMYMRCLDEREAKLKALTANIKLSIDKSTPVRSTKLAYVDDVLVKPPRNVIRQQVKFGTAKATTKSSDLKKKLITNAAAAVTAGSSSGASTSSERITVPNPVRIRAPTAAMKKAKAPLMAKALQAIKGRYKR